MVTLKDVQKAHKVVSQLAHHTPLIYSRTFSEMAGAQLFLKAENLQRSGSFKVRGAANKIAHLSSRERLAGVVAASAGNHAQGLAMASMAKRIPCTIVMPKGASLAKIEATRGYGAHVILHGESYDEAQKHSQALAQEKGLTLVHGFDDPQIIAGQGTVGLEICRDMPDVDVVAVPVGGGGLIAGIATAVKGVRPEARVIGVQAKNAHASADSFKRGRRVHTNALPTIADGIAIAQPGQLTFPIIQKLVDDIVTVSEEEIAHAVLLLLERGKLLVEGAGAVGLAALLAGKISCLDKKVVTVLSGGNLDPNLLSRIIDHGMAHAGRYMRVQVVLDDKPGQLARLLEAVAEAEANVLDVEHERHGIHLPLGKVQVALTMETRDRDHARQVMQRLQERGYMLKGPSEKFNTAR